MIQLRHRQPSLWHSGMAKDIEDLWEPWMEEADQLLEDAALVESVYDAQGKRHRQEPDAWAHANTGGSGASAVDLEARAELELRHAGARSPSEPGVSRVHPHWRRERYQMPRRWHDWDKSSGQKDPLSYTND